MDPGSGDFRYGPGAAINDVVSLTINQTTADGANVINYLLDWGIQTTSALKGYIIVRSNDNSDNTFTIWKLLAVVDNGTYIQCDVTYVSGGYPNANEECVILFVPTGEKGQTGGIGPGGPKGQKGAPGTDGNDGSNGDKGQKGEAGPNGKDGTDGTDGSNGDKGQKGEAGNNGKDGNDGSNGDKGQKGEAGQKGQTGDQGDQGEKGEQGEQGEQGEPGENGKNGKTGEDGEKGAPGENGSKGQKGEEGSAGPPGPGGGDGNPGPPGPASTVAGPKGQKGAAGDDSTVAGPKGQKGEVGGPGAKGGAGDAGVKGEPGFGYEFEHIALNPVARDEAVTAAQVGKAFVKVPTSITTDYYLYSLESSFGAIAATGTTSFRLLRVNSAGTATGVTNGSFSHTGGALMATKLFPDQTVDDLGGDYVYVQLVSTPTGTPQGYTVTLIWKKK